MGETSPLNDFLNDYAYDGLGRLTELVQSGTNQPTLHRKQVELSYNSAGRYSEIVRSQGASGSEVEVATGTYSYFDVGALEEIAYDRSGTTISGYAWTYDNVGRVSTFTAPEGAFTYGYDGRGQLTSAAFTLPDTTSDPNRSETFNWDGTGNETTDASYNAANQITLQGSTGDDGFTYEYDSEGNTWRVKEYVNGAVSQIIRQFWDTRNRLASYQGYVQRLDCVQP